MVIELIAGFVTNALVLIADAGHMFLDSAALGLAWWSAVLSQKGDDEKLSYGYHRMQVLAAFVNGLSLLILAIWITWESLVRLASPESILPLPTLIVGIMGLIINLVVYRWLHNSSNNLNVKSAALHVLGDLLGSFAAILASLAVLFFGWALRRPCTDNGDRFHSISWRVWSAKGFYYDTTGRSSSRIRPNRDQTNAKRPVSFGR